MRVEFHGGPLGGVSIKSDGVDLPPVLRVTEPAGRISLVDGVLTPSEPKIAQYAFGVVGGVVRYQLVDGENPPDGTSIKGQSNRRRVLLSFTSWVLDRVSEMDHGCLTGDCDHMLQELCIHALVSDYLTEKGLS